MTDIKALRPDWEVAKQIAQTHGLEMARQWMRLPLVDLRLDAAPTRLEKEQVRQVLSHLVFDWAVYFVNLYMEPLNSTPMGNIAINAVYDQDGGEVVCSAWLRLQGTKWKNVGTLTINIDTVHISVKSPRSYSDPDTLRTGTHKLALAWFSALYMAEIANMYPVTVEPEDLDNLPPKQARKLAKTRQTKPWLDPRAPRVILLNPTKRYPEHGRGGSHASPMPHQRRGHWRTLQAERYGDRRGQRVWVKPAWIGPTEWAYNGNVYRVIEQANG